MQDKIIHQRPLKIPHFVPETLFITHYNVKDHAINDFVPDTLFINHYNVKGQHAIQDFYRTRYSSLTIM